jgi:hypothetical protein
MSSLVFQILSWPMFAIALFVFGFAPGTVLRLSRVVACVTETSSMSS